METITQSHDYGIEMKLHTGSEFYRTEIQDSINFASVRNSNL